MSALAEALIDCRLGARVSAGGAGAGAGAGADEWLAAAAAPTAARAPKPRSVLPLILAAALAPLAGADYRRAALAEALRDAPAAAATLAPRLDALAGRITALQAQ